MIGYPDQIYDEDYLLESSQPLNLTQGKDLFKTVQEYVITVTRNDLADLPYPVDKMK